MFERLHMLVLSLSNKSKASIKLILCLNLQRETKRDLIHVRPKTSMTFVNYSSQQKQNFPNLFDCHPSQLWNEKTDND